MKLLRHEYDDKNEITSILSYISDTFLSLSNRGLMGLEELGKSGIITEENNAIMVLYRQAIAFIDSLVSVTKAPSVEAIIIIVRSFFEVKCYLEYIMQNNTNNRAICLSSLLFKRTNQVS